MAASTDAAPLERDLADVAAELVVHLELQNARLRSVYERAHRIAGPAADAAVDVPEGHEGHEGLTHHHEVSNALQSR